jgi:hypothetical protein
MRGCSDTITKGDSTLQLRIACACPSGPAPMVWAYMDSISEMIGVVVDIAGIDN